jgi:putative ABC transport system permease protein
VALLAMIIRKMIKNKWLELSLLLGLMLSVAMVSTIPIYTDAILQRMLIKDLENRQIKTNQYSGLYWSSLYMNETINLNNRERIIHQIDNHMEHSAKPGFSLPVQHYVQERITDRYILAPTYPDKVDPSIKRVAEIGALSNLQENVRLVEGRLPAKEPVDGVYEALVMREALNKLTMVLGNEFTIEHKKIKETIRVKPVGIIEQLDEHDLFFYNKRVKGYNSVFFIDFELFEQEITEGQKLHVRAAYWLFAMDYSNIDMNNINNFIQTSQNTESFIANRIGFYNIEAPILDTIKPYLEREKRLRTMLWSLNVPVMIMLAYYLFMVSNLIINRQKTEISVLRSRGASRFQIMMAFVVEGLILGAVAMLAGPYLGLLFTKVLGASNGFLEFVQRSALQVDLGKEAYKYAFIAVIGSIIMTLLPAFIATRVTIVGHKQQMARVQKSSFWHKYFIDIILMSIAIYGLTIFYRRMKDLQSLGLDSLNFSIDPMLFLVPALFIIGMGLFILRLYPWFIRLIYWIGRKWWSPPLYSTLIQVGRSSLQYQFIMVFLTITIATGLFSASAARTLNKNAEDQILYATGADMVLNIRWENDAPPPRPPGMPAPTPEPGEVNSQPKRTQYTEPPFIPITQLPGVEHAAKVFVQNDAYFTTAVERGSVKLIGIETDQFGRTAWLRDHLLEHHFYDYLNLIAADSTAVLISRTMAEQKGIKEGDHIQLAWTGLPQKPFVVYGIIDYFPTFNPNPKGTLSSAELPPAPMLVVGHLEYIQNNLALEPYEIWLKLKPDATREALFEALAEQKIPVVSLKDSRNEMIEQKNDPFQLAVNGVMTLGFIISIIISFCGFLLYWILSLMSRILQMGIFRAMGISFRQLIGMMAAEQVLTSGAAILIGILTGHVTSEIFVPLFQMSFNPATQVPPFEVSFASGDAVQLYWIVSFMITLGLIILGFMVSRIKIHQAVKLGED